MPTIQLPRKIERILTTKARFIVLIGGRGSAKSESAGRFVIMRSQTEQADILCGREYQKNIEESVHKLLKGLIGTLGVQGTTVLKNEINFSGGGGFRYQGFSRDPGSVKSAQGFKYAWIEEAQTLSEQSIKDLTPTIREKGSQIVFTANPQSAADPFSQRFIVPFLDTVQRDGYYEDEMHLVIMCNWSDNPWWDQLPELQMEREWDFDNLPRALYDHIWEGAFNDSVEDALILSEWFDACVDAHTKLGFEPVGVKAASHDPSDLGPDDKGYGFRHGSVILDVQDKPTGTVNEGGRWATGLALQHSADTYTWDGDGMGVALAEDTEKAFKGKHTTVSMFRGSETPDDPDEIYQPSECVPLQEQKTNRDAFKNKRAQYHFLLRDRCYRTFQAVTQNVWCDPDKMISFDSGITALAQLRSELCRLPVKPNGNGKFELYTKEEMKRKFKLKSPNLADTVMMLMRVPKVETPININFAKAAW